MPDTRTLISSEFGKHTKHAAVLTSLQRRITNWGPWLLAVGVCLALLPFFALAWYSHPSSDDFLLANGVREHGVLGYQHYMYFNWTGRYSSILFSSLLSPLSYSGWEKSYRLVPLLFLVGLVATFYLLLRGLLQSAIKGSAMWLASGVLLVLLLFQLPSTAEGLYWVTGLYTYLLPGALVLLWLIALARRSAFPGHKVRWLLLALVLQSLAIGSNEVVALPLLIGLVSFTVVRAVQQRRLPPAYALLSLAAAVACAVSFLAPGNFVRMAGEPLHHAPVKASGLAAAAAAYCVVNWLGNGVLVAVTLLLLPSSVRLAQHPGLAVNHIGRNPLLITALLFGLLVVGFFPSFWATGMPIPLRARNMLYLFFLVGWFVQAHAWVRYFLQQGWWPKAPQPVYVSVLLSGWLALAFLTDHNLRLRGSEQLANSNNTILAYREWISGAAHRYDAQLGARYQQLRTLPPMSACTVAALQTPPSLLLFLDLSSDNPQDWTNQEYAKFFNKREIRVAEAP